MLFYVYNKDGFFSPALKKRVICILLFTIDFELCFIKNITRDNKETYYIISFYERNRIYMNCFNEMQHRINYRDNLYSLAMYYNTTVEEIL